MNPDNLWKKELIEFTKNRKTLVVKFILPIILTIPVLIPGMPLNVKSSIFTLILIFISVFGSAIGLIQLKESKMIERLSVLPVSNYKFTMNYLIGTSIMDVLKFSLPALFLVLFNVTIFQAFSLSWFISMFVISVIFANSLGIIVALSAKSSGEVHLYSIIMVLGVSALSGVFFMALPDPINIISNLIPFHYLATSISDCCNGIISLSVIPFIMFAIVLFMVFLVSSRLFKLE